jgi:hypothetical protein
MAKKLDTREAAITRRVFRGVSTSTPRGLSDCYTLREIQAIAADAEAGIWQQRAEDYLAAQDEAYSQEWE